MTKISITTKLLALGIILVLVPSIIVGYVGYNAAQTAVYQGVRERLQAQAEDWRIIAKAYNEEITAQEARVRKSAQSIVTAQSKITYELIDEALVEQGGVLPETSREDIFTRLNRNTVGATGYTWIIDYVRQSMKDPPRSASTPAPPK